MNVQLNCTRFSLWWSLSATRPPRVGDGCIDGLEAARLADEKRARLTASVLRRGEGLSPGDTLNVDRVAAATVEWSWIAYFLLILGAALAAASATIWFFSGMRFWSRKNHLPAN